MSSLTTSQVASLLNSIQREKRKTDLEDKLRRWAQPPGTTEKEKCERAVRMIKLAMEADKELATKDISVYAKGSYANRTNIPSDSDVDVAVCLNNQYFNDYPPDKLNSDFGMTSSDYKFSDFKNTVAKAVENYFGKENVTIGNKAIQVHSNTVRVDADVVPHFTHRRYNNDGSFLEGVALKTSDSTIVKNWPQQDYDNGVDKNDRTSKKYKAFVRILKNLRCEMKDNGYTYAQNVPSYLISCLVWNVPDYFFDEDSYVKILKDIVAYLKDQTSDLVNVKEWGEVNELKYLFRSSQGWTLENTHNFLIATEQYLGKII